MSEHIDDEAAATTAADDALRALDAATRAAALAQQALREAATWARRAGAPIQVIADTAGVTRQTIYRWTREADGEVDGEPVSVRETLDSGLVILASYGDTMAARYPGGQGTVTGAIAAWKTGLRNLQWNTVDEEDQAILRQVSAVVGLAANSQAKTGRWPRTVRL